MDVGKINKNKVVAAFEDTNIFQVAKLMKEHNVGDVIVVTTNNMPVGIITDRDIIIKIIAAQVDPKEILASDMMSRDLLILKEYQSLQEGIDMMCAKGVRRAPIVNDANFLVGIISTDDIAVHIADELESYSKLIRKQILSV